MADRIPTYQSKVQVNDAPGFNVSLPAVADVGQEIGSLGTTLLQIAEPHVRERAIKFAETEAAELKLSKTPDGHYERAQNTRIGAGSVYREAFDKIIQGREISLYDADHQDVLNQLQEQHQHDPQGYLAAAEAYGTGQLEKVNPDVRAQVEVNYTREMTQRMNQIRSDTMRANTHMAIDATQSEIAALDKKMEALSTELPGPDTKKLIDDLIPQYEAAYRRLAPLGEVNEQGIQARMAQVRVMTDLAKKRGEGFSQISDLGTQVVGETELAPLYVMRDVLSGSGAADGVTIYGKKGIDWKRDIPIPLWDNAKVVVNQRISTLERAEALRIQEDALAAQQDTAESILTAISDQNYDPMGGRSKAQVAADDAQLMEHGSISEQMVERDPATGKMVGQDRILGYIQTKGGPPDKFVGWLDGNSNGQLLPTIANFLATARQARSAQGTFTGMKMWGDLDSKTRARVEAYYSLKRLGVDDQTIIANIQQQSMDQTVKVSDLDGLYKYRNMTYEDYKHRAIQAAFDLKSPSDAHALTVVEKDFDNNLAFYKSVGMSNDEAMQTATDTLGRFYVADKIFLIGVGPKQALPAGIAAADYDKALLGPNSPITPAMRGSATFSNHQLKLMPLEYDPDRGELGMWNVVVIGADGQAKRTIQVDMQKHMPNVIRSKMIAERKREQALVQQAIKTHTQKKTAAENQRFFETEAIPPGGPGGF